MPSDGVASIQIKAGDGRVVRTLAETQAFAKGDQSLVWDRLDDAGHAVAPGEYLWSGAVTGGIHAKLRGWACADFGTPWKPADGKPQWGGDAGVPSAVAADAERVYLGWSGARAGSAVLACDLEGRPLWSWRDHDLDRRVPGGTGVQALSVDAGVVTVLKGLEGIEVKGYELIKLDAETGQAIPWPENRRLNIEDLWPADAKSKPRHADGMAARAGRIFLTFTEEQFLAVLDGQTGAYLQTVVGAPPELIYSVPTKTESAEEPGKLMDVDFAVVSLRGGVIGKVLFAHDPVWVVTSEMEPLEREERITALSVIGDGAKHHQHSVFVGLGAPFHQVQRRALLNTEGFEWSAGKTGGRQTGAWVPEAMGPIRGVALDARGRLWVAEGSATPPRFSVWETAGNEGRLLREFYGPAVGGGAAVFPGDPDVFVGACCEWRIDPQTGQSRCLGVISREGDSVLGFISPEPGKYELLIENGASGSTRLARIGDGHYEPRAADAAPVLQPREEKFAGQCIGEVRSRSGGRSIRFIRTKESLLVVTADDLVLGRLFRGSRPARAELGADFTDGPMGHDSGSHVTQAADARVFFSTSEAGLWVAEITGFDTIQPLVGGTLRIGKPPR